MIIDAEGHILGRLATWAAKQALLGENVIIINADKAIISGRKDMVFEEYSERLKIKNIGNYRKGPFHQRRPDKFVRRSIRGMLPLNKSRGREAFKRVMVYINVPKRELQQNHNVDVDNMEIQKLDHLKKSVDRYVTVADVCRFIGSKC